MNLAAQALDSGNLARAIELLEKYRPTGSGVREQESGGRRQESASKRQPSILTPDPRFLAPDLRGWEWRYLWGQTRSPAVAG